MTKIQTMELAKKNAKWVGFGLILTGKNNLPKRNLHKENIDFYIKNKFKLKYKRLFLKY